MGFKDELWVPLEGVHISRARRALLAGVRSLIAGNTVQQAAEEWRNGYREAAAEAYKDKDIVSVIIAGFLQMNADGAGVAGDSTATL
jgi:hypothetical protein